MLENGAARRAALFWFLGIAAAAVAFVLWNDPLRWAVVRLQPLGVAALFLAACTGFGLLARAPDLLTAAAVGCGIAGALSFAAALAHLLRPATFIVILAIGIARSAAAALPLFSVAPERRRGRRTPEGILILT